MPGGGAPAMEALVDVLVDGARPGMGAAPRPRPEVDPEKLLT